MLTDAFVFVVVGGGYEGTMLFGGDADLGDECPPFVASAVLGDETFVVGVADVVLGFDRFCWR